MYNRGTNIFNVLFAISMYDVLCKNKVGGKVKLYLLLIVNYHMNSLFIVKFNGRQDFAYKFLPDLNREIIQTRQELNIWEA